MPTKKQAEHLASAIEKGLIVSPEEWSRRVRAERLRAIETENSRNRLAARIGSAYSSTWPAGGEPVRARREDAATEWTVEHAARPVVKELTIAARLAERKLFGSDFRGVPPFVRKATGRTKAGQAEPAASPLEGGSYADSGRRVAVDAIDQEPWRRVSKPRVLSDAETKRIDVFYSQRLLGTLKVKGAGILIRPLDPAVDLVQVMDTMRADAGADADVDIMEIDEWLTGLVERPSKAAGQWAAAEALRTNLQEGDASALYSIVDEVTSRSVGVVSLRDDAPEALRVEIARIVLPRSLCCSAVLFQCLQLLLEHIFENICYTRVKITCCASVPRLASLFLQLGFRYEGMKRKALCSSSSYHDLLVFRMLDNDWRNKGKDALDKKLMGYLHRARGSSGELESFWQRTHLTRDLGLESDDCYARIAANAALELAVGNTMSFVFCEVLRCQKVGCQDPFLKIFSAENAHTWNSAGNSQGGAPVTSSGSGLARLGRGELTGKYVVLQPLQAYGGLYEGQTSPIFSKLTAEEVYLRYALPATLPDETRLQLYLWKLTARNASTFALRVGVKGDGKPRDLITRANLPTAGYIFARVVEFPCQSLEVGPVWLDKADEFVHVESWSLLLEHAFQAGLARVEVIADASAANLCLQLLRLGFVFERTMRHWHVSENLLKDVVCFSIVLEEKEYAEALRSRRTQGLIKDELGRCILPPLSEALEFTVAFQRPAIGVEFTDSPPIFAKRIHPVKGLGLPATLTEIAHDETGPFLVAVDSFAADGLTRKELLALLRALPRPVILTFRARSARPKDPTVHVAHGGYKEVLGVRASLLSETYKRDHPRFYTKGPAGFSERQDVV